MSVEIPSDDVDGAEICALEGCGLGVPARTLDEHGRAKGGRRPRYCGKPHADLASRQRRAREHEAIADPLALARSAGEALVPAARELAARLAEVIARFDQAEAGALARVSAAEQEAAQAQADAVAAREASELAEQARRQALAESRLERQAREAAVNEAERVRVAAEQIRTAAWQQVADHERSRGHAEAARAAAEAAADSIAAQNRQLREQLELARTTIRDGVARLASTAHELARAQGETATLVTRIEALEELRAQQAEHAEQARRQLAVQDQRAATAETELAAERARSQEERVARATTVARRVSRSPAPRRSRSFR